jgi:hypothetical protein
MPPKLAQWRQDLGSILLQHGITHEDVVGFLKDDVALCSKAVIACCSFRFGNDGAAVSASDDVRLGGQPDVHVFTNGLAAVRVELFHLSADLTSRDDIQRVLCDRIVCALICRFAFGDAGLGAA